MAGKKELTPWNEKLRLWLLLVIALGAVLTLLTGWGNALAWAVVEKPVKCEIKKANEPVLSALEKIYDVLEYRNFIDNEMVPDSILTRAEKKYIHYKKATGR